MKVTKIRNIEGSKITLNEVENLAQAIINKVASKGFITEAVALSRTSMKIGLHMRTFSIDTNTLGYNARVDRFTAQYSSKGYKRTNLPTWTQREDFNHLVNEVLDLYQLKANIVSGPFIIRSYNEGAVDQWNAYEGYEKYYGTKYHMFQSLPVLEIHSEIEAREMCDSEAKEYQHKMKMLIENRVKSKVRREKLKALMSAKRVKIGEAFTQWDSKMQKYNNKSMTLKAYLKLLNTVKEKSGSWTLKRLKNSITLEVA